MSGKVKGRRFETIDHLKCGEPVWRGIGYVCPKHPRVRVPKTRLPAGAEPEPVSKSPAGTGRDWRQRVEEPQPGLPYDDALTATTTDSRTAVFLDAMLKRLRHSLLTEVEDLAAVGNGINKRLDAIDEKLETLLTEPDHARLDADIMEAKLERLDAIDEKLETLLTEPDHARLDADIMEAKLEEIRAEMARIDLGGVDLAPAADPPAEAPAKPAAEPPK